MIRIVAKQLIREDSCDKFIDIARELVELVRQEEGNVSYNLHRSVDNPRVLCFIETWKDMDAVDAHLNSEHFKRISPSLDALMEEGPVLEAFEEVL